MKTPTIAIKALLFCTLLSFFNCNNKATNEGIKLIPRNSYFIDFHKGISIYRDNISRNVMDGYYVIGDESKKWEEFYVKQGVLNNDYIVYHNNGEKYTHSKYHNGVLHGEDLLYYISGKLKKFSAYNRGELYGKVIEYYEGGQVRSESSIKNEKVISSSVFSETGDLISKMYTKDNKSITQEFKDGKLLSEEISSNYDDFKAEKLYNNDGTLDVSINEIDRE
ncbi:Antitoxin component YwqK of the YwqJK toxin-antitoxin module [Flaviramulus basaltis]|uniref:Antitoxin component YwqK of the YwqJK toxin-antitoxin module n=1 Tax=Flaviramulus basaltis TaxID=369401 RepID=A0A1K2ID44_9FLAO|nr:hypothetical protein [Flaviramulus basaltis]SFZ90311.1 Antitoxin component YwqK of the YwqJK toxin-antitoxin module [Flaviramulus basaltis]